MTLARKLRRLPGLSVDELAVRLGQAGRAAAERWGLSSQTRLPSDEAFLRRGLDRERFRFAGAQALLDHFVDAPRPLPSRAFADRDATKSAFCAYWPAREAALLTRAEQILAGRFEIFGRVLEFGQPIDWHLDPVAGRRAPSIHWSRIRYLDAGRFGDHKVIWELNRHQHLVTLGQAYWLSGEERFGDEWARQLEQWMAANPPKRGINWASSLELAFRSIAWLWSLHFFRGSSRLTPGLLVRLLKYLDLQARHVERYLSTYFSPNTHLTGEALGLFYVGTLLPELRDAPRWQRLGLRILLEQLSIQVLDDGVYCERASCYHRYTTDFYLHLLTLTAENGVPLPAEVAERVGALLEHLVHLTRPDGSTPLVGDDDGGRLLPLDERAVDDFRGAIATGAAILQRPDFRFAADEAAEETLWLLGPAGLAAFERLRPVPPAATSRGFASGGYYVMRDGWRPDANYLLVDCGAHGFLNGGHAHAGALSVELATGGRPVIVDPGTCDYTRKPELRAHFRSALAHNSLLVGGEGSAVPGGPFDWRHRADARARRWITARRFDFVEGEHDGFARFDPPATHSRAILFLKRDYWVIRDRVESSGAYASELRLHFPPGVRLEATGSGAVARDDSGDLLRIAILGGSGAALEPAPFSPGFGRLTEATRLRVAAPPARDLLTLLLPQPHARREADIQVEVGASGLLLTVGLEGCIDTLAIAASGEMETGDAYLEGDWAWWRRDRESAAIREFLIINGSRLRVAERTLFTSESPVEHVAAVRLGDRLEVESAAVGCVLDALGASRVRLGGTDREVKAEGMLVLGGAGDGAGVSRPASLQEIS